MDTELVPVQPSVGLLALSPSDLISAWLAGRKATTIRAYQGDLDHFARAIGIPTAAAAVEQLLASSAGDANGLALAYRNAMIDHGDASASINRRLAALRSVVKLARKLGRIVWSLEVDGVKAEARRDVKGPDPKGMARVWKALDAAGDGPRPRRDRAIAALLFDLALRRGELVSLDLADVDFRASTIAVLGKGNREKITLNLAPATNRAVGEWVLVRGNHEGPLFVRTDRPGSTKALTGGGIGRAIARAGVAAKLDKKLRPHGLRHSAITTLLASGNNVRDVKLFARHRSVETTMAYDDALHDPSACLSADLSKIRK